MTHRVHATAGLPAVAPAQKSPCSLAVHNQLCLSERAALITFYRPPSTFSTNPLVCLLMALTL